MPWRMVVDDQSDRRKLEGRIACYDGAKRRAEQEIAANMKDEPPDVGCYERA
jgi:hypothetical protein